MKKFIYGLLAICLITISCQQEDSPLENLQDKKIPLDSFFEKVIAENASAKKEDNAFYIDYVWNKESKTVEITKVTEKELDFFVLEKALSEKERSEKKYKVTCTKNGKDLWTKECDGKLSCGTLVYDCLEDGGCGTVCKNKMIYIPQNNQFILIEA